MKTTGRQAAKAGPARPRARMSGVDRKRQIARVAAKLFASRGFRGTTTREIARKAGISEAVIFKHFSRKEDLYRAIIEARCAGAEGDSRLISMLRGKSGVEVFRVAAIYLLDEHSKDPSFMRLLTYSALEGQPLSELFIKTRGLELLSFLEGHIRELVRRRSVREIDAALAARAFIGMVIHYSLAQEMYGLKSRFSRPNQVVADAFVDIFFNGIERR